MIVNGHKMWVTGAGVCDMMLVLATIGKNEKGHNRNIWLAVNQEESPFVQRKIYTLGLKQGHLGEAIFDNCRVPKRNIIGQEGTGGRVLKATWADAAGGLTDLARLNGMLSDIQGRIQHRSLPRVSPLAVPLLLEVGRESVPGRADDDLLGEAAALIHEATDPTA